MNSAKQVFKNFVGCWRLRRVLGSYGHGEGTANFILTSECPLTIHYREELVVNYTTESGLKGNVGGTAHQEYIYVYEEERDKILKRFMDGRNFYEIKLDLDKMEGDGEHLCDEDFYKAKYTFKDCNNFALFYDVKGPQKDYVIQTAFTRDSDIVS